MPQTTARRHSARAKRKAALAAFHELAQHQGAAWRKRVFACAGVDRPSAMPTSLLRFIVAYDYDLVPEAKWALSLKTLHRTHRAAE